MSVAEQLNIGAFIKPFLGIKATNAGAAVTVTGAVIDRTGFSSMVLHGFCGDAAGSPTAQTVDFRLQQSPTSGGSFADVTDEVLTQLTADNTAAERDIDLSGLDNFIKVICDIVLTGGSTPTIPVGSSVILGGSDARAV